MKVGFKLQAALLLVVGVFISGCVTREDIRGIQTDLFTIQKGLESKLGSVEDQTNTVQTTQADLRLDMRELSQNIEALNAELQDSRTRVAELATRLDDLEATLKTRLDAQIELLSGSKFTEKPLPSTVYNLANTDFARGRIPEAIKGFKSYIEKFPKGDRVPEAKLKIATGLSKQKRYSSAVTEYSNLIQEFPKNRVVPTALLRQAQAYEKLGRKKMAKKVYQNLIKKYSFRPEAKTAQENLRNLSSK